MEDRESIKTQICSAFQHERYPGDDNLRREDIGFEPYLVEDEFKGKSDWAALDPQFLDQSPDSLASALGLLSDDAFRFYIPAYMIADLEERLQRVNPVFYLTYNLDDPSRTWSDAHRRYYGGTPFESTVNRFAAFTPEEASAVVSYLTYKKALLDTLDDDQPELVDDQHKIERALTNCWLHRVE